MLLFSIPLILTVDLLIKQSEFDKLKKLADNHQHEECSKISNHRSVNPLVSSMIWGISEECYAGLLEAIKKEYEENRFSKLIIDRVKSIPENSRYYQEANQLYKEWTAQENYGRAQQIFKSCKSYSAEENIKNFDEALNYLKKIDKNTDLWRREGKNLFKEIAGMKETNPSCKL